MKEIADKGYDLLSIGETKETSEVRCSPRISLDEIFNHFSASALPLMSKIVRCWTLQ
jgi:hypothetical protein